MTPNYTTDKKWKARHATIIATYRAVFGVALPPLKQYWSLCATCVDSGGNVLRGSELHQLLDVGMIQPEQFHGVDRDEDIYRANLQYRRANWYCNDIYDALSIAADQPDFNPGIVNIDTLHEPRRGVVLFCDVLERLRTARSVLFVGNFLLKNRSRIFTANDVVTEFMSNTQWRDVAATLEWGDAFFRYNGATKGSRTDMCTVMLWRY